MSVAFTKRGSTQHSSLELEAIGQLRQLLLNWYANNGRDLPWRHTRDPYPIWVSEMMCQQTQVATVIHYFERWMARFPTLEALARADEQDVLHAWQGLGYYRRARNLLAGARAIQEGHEGVFPQDAMALLSLPGIGPYTAGAIASIAFGERAAVVDGNVIRVLTRLFALGGDPARAPLKAELWRIAGELVPSETPGDFNQAVMELGATLCTPLSPRCDRCPIAAHCLARAEGRPEAYPETAAAPKATAVRMVAAVIRDGNRVVLVRHDEKAARWAGMWHFPALECDDAETDEAAVLRIARELTGLAVRPLRGMPLIRHSVTRYRITLTPMVCEPISAVGGDGEDWKWVELGSIDGYPLPAAHQKIARQIGTGQSSFAF